MATVRSKGFRKLLIGMLGAIAVGAIFYLVRRAGYAPTSLALIPFAFPGVYALMGALEIITGVPFSELAVKWDELAGWQRGILGVLVVTVAIFAFTGVMALAFG